MRITALAGGIGAARFLVGLLLAAPDAEITVVGNTGDDMTVWGLPVCPDLDTVMYTLGGGVDQHQGWGRSDESHIVQAELARHGVGPDWFGLGDRDLATHILRGQLLAQGRTLSDATRTLCRRWETGVTLLPMSDEPVETHVLLADGREVHFQEWWVAMRASVPALRIRAVGVERSAPAPGVVEAIEQADVILFPPSNPVVSIGTILQVPGIAAAVRAARAPVVGVSPIIGGTPVRGMADACLSAIGVESSAAAVAAHYGARSAGGVLDGWLVHPGDEQDVPGVEVRAVPIIMSDVEATARMAREALKLARGSRDRH